MHVKTAREQVLHIVMEVLENKKHSDTIYHQVFHTGSYSTEERRFIKKLSYGVIERFQELDFIISCYSKVKIPKMKPIIRNILRIGVYECKYMSRIPNSAACNEAVKLAGIRGLSGLKGFVNGVLRSISRDGFSKVPEYTLSEKYSMPEFILSLLTGQNPGKPEVTEAVLQSFFEEKPVTLRVNQNKVPAADCLRAITEAGYKAEPGRYHKEAICIMGSGDIHLLPGFAEGHFIIQDESAMLPVKCADIKKGQKILDICAAPGGKTLQAAEYTGDTGIVYARDLTDYKCRKIEENAKRLGFSNIDIKCRNAAGEAENELTGKMDTVIADVPCSGLGVIGKKPEIKYRITETSVKELVTLQRSILDNAVAYVKPGGILIYSTCTLNRQENEENVAYLMQNHSFQPESLQTYLPDEWKEFEKEPGMVTILPGISKSDGFFAARLRKAGG